MSGCQAGSACRALNAWLNLDCSCCHIHCCDEGKGCILLLWRQWCWFHLQLDRAHSHPVVSWDGKIPGFSLNITFVFLPSSHAKVQNQKLRVLIYNGDADPGLNSHSSISLKLTWHHAIGVSWFLQANCCERTVCWGFYAQNWTTAVGIPEVQSWRPWTRDGKMKMGGYVAWKALVSRGLTCDFVCMISPLLFKFVYQISITSVLDKFWSDAWGYTLRTWFRLLDHSWCRAYGARI